LSLDDYHVKGECCFGVALCGRLSSLLLLNSIPFWGITQRNVHNRYLHLFPGRSQPRCKA